LSSEQAELVAKFAAGVVDSGGKFAAGVVDTGGNLHRRCTLTCEYLSEFSKNSK
jgi:hypothetical protein